MRTLSQQSSFNFPDNTKNNKSVIRDEAHTWLSIY
jgi:hypothetical protein